MVETWEALVNLLRDLGILLADIGGLLLRWSLVISWLAWWLWGVNWRKVWPVLAQGAWVPVVLVMVTAGLVWSQIAPSDCVLLGIVVVPNFWCQLGGVCLVVGATLLCGWLQAKLRWEPAEVELEPPVASAVHGHEHH